MVLKVDQLIVASDFGPKFLNFWPIVSQTWHLVFGIRPELALVYKPDDFDRVQDLKPDLQKYGVIHFLEAAPLAPLGNQAKLARFYIAGQKENSFTMVDDIDTVHVRADYLVSKFNEQDQTKFIGLGGDVYRGTPHERNFPAGNFSGPGYLFAELLNPRNLQFSDYIKSFDTAPVYSSRENPYNTLGKFSDEYLIAAAFHRRNLGNKLVLLNRDQNIKREWLDRNWWASKEEISENASHYETINFLRPLLDNRVAIQEALDILTPGVRIEVLTDERLKIGLIRKLLTRWIAI